MPGVTSPDTHSGRERPPPAPTPARPLAGRGAQAPRFWDPNLGTPQLSSRGCAPVGKGEITDQFHIGGIQLPVVSSCRDLAVTIRNDLSPSDHITDIVVRAHRRANLIHRCFISRNVTLLVRSFLT